MNMAVVALGSNIDPDKNIKKARALLKDTFDVVAESRFVSTDPLGYVHQPRFLNGALLIQTDMDHRPFRESLKEMERLLGRKQTRMKSGPRIIDLDIIVWNNRVVDKDVYSRDFLKASIHELLPDLEILPC